MERIATATYDACRDRRLQLESFPDVTPLVAEMQRLSKHPVGDSPRPADSSTFKVTAQQPGGSLVVKEIFFEQFGDLDEFAAVIEQHNKTYNTDGLRLKETAVTPQKKAEIEKTPVLSVDEPLTSAKMSALPNASQPQPGKHVVVC